MDIAGGITNILPGPLDNLRGPYATISAACAAIPNVVVGGKNFRMGKFAEIGSGLPYVTHWWESSYTDNGLVPYISASLSPLEYRGTYDASAGLPDLTDETGQSGWFYDVVSAGTRNFGSGNITLSTGDTLRHDGSKWNKISGSEIGAPSSSEEFII